MVSVTSLSIFSVTPDSRFDKFFRLHPEAPYVWTNLLVDSEDLTANVPTKHEADLLRSAVYDVIIPYFQRAEICSQDSSRKSGFRPLVGDIRYEGYEKAAKFIAGNLAAASTRIADKIENTDDLKDIVLMEIFGHDKQEAVRSFFQSLKEQGHQMISRPSYDGVDKYHFQLVVLGRTTK